MEGVRVKDCRWVTTKDHDGRTNGKLIEVVSEGESFLENSPFIEQAYITICRPGRKKGLHVHKLKTDRFCVIRGQARIYYTEGEIVHYIFFSAHDPKLIIIPPGVGHGIECLGDSSCWVLNCPDKKYRKDEPDQEEIDVEW